MSQSIISFALFITLFLALLGFQRLYYYAALRLITVGHLPRERIGYEELPEELRPIFDEMAKRLQLLGFEVAEFMKGEPFYRNAAKSVLYSQYLYHPETKTFATVTPPHSPVAGEIATLVFETWLHDGNVIATLNRQGDFVLSPPANYQALNAMVESSAAQWQLHLDRIKGVGSERVENFDDMVARNEALHQELLAVGVSEKRIEPCNNNEWRLRRLPALRLALRLATMMKRISRLPASTDVVSPEARIAADLYIYSSFEANNVHLHMRRRMRMIMFFISLLLGAVAFGVMFSWGIVPVLLGVLLFHEFGHALVMRATGYKGIQVMVIPLLGAVAIGRKDDATPMQRLAVLLAGPLPGLLIAIGMLLLLRGTLADHPSLLAIAISALVINLFNLLPLTPLDGGRIVELFLFSRWPRARLFFFAASAVALGVLAVWIKTYPLLIFALFFLLVAKRFHFNTGIAKQIGRVDKAAAPRAIFSVLHATGGKQLKSFAQRNAVVRAVIPMLTERPVSYGETFFGLSAYVAIVALPFVILSGVPSAERVFQHFKLIPKQERTEQTQDDWRQQLAKAKSDDERFGILTDQAQDAEDDDEEPDRAHALYQEAMGVADHFPQGDLRILDTKLGLARTEADGASRLAAFRTLLEKTAQLQGAERYRYAMVLEEVTDLDSAAPVKQKIGYLREAIAAWGSNADARYNIGNDHVMIAKLLFASKNPGEAESALRAAVAANDTSYMALSLAWFLIEQGRANEASVLLQNYPVDMKSSPYQSSKLADTLAWSLWAQGKQTEALKVMNDALEQGGGKNYWTRRPLLFDMITFAGSDLVLRTHWRAKLKSELLNSGENYASVQQDIDMWRDDEPWDQQRTVARYEVLRILGLPKQLVTQACR